jgi:hypothetical protein
MGCFDIFCFICGNPCHGTLQNKNDILETIQLYYDPKIKKSKWFRNYAKKIIEASEKNPKFIDSLDTKWMKNCTMLLNDNTVLHDCKEVACNNVFYNSKTKKKYNHDPNNIYDPEIQVKGIFIHTDCWEWCAQKHKVKLTYGMLPFISSKNINKSFDFINYGEIEKYWEQDFDFISLAADNKSYLCSSPLKNDKNINQINKNFKGLKIRVGRKGPSVSASFYEDGIYKLGNDGKIWVTKGGKWYPIPGKIERTEVKTLPKNIDFIAGSNTEPVFIESTNKNIFKLITQK